MITGISSKPAEKVQNAYLYFKYTNILIKKAILARTVTVFSPREEIIT